MAIAPKRPKCPYCGETIGTISDKPFDDMIYPDWKGHNEICSKHPLRRRLINMKSTVLRVKCTKIAKEESYQKNEDGSSKLAYDIALSVPYTNDVNDPNYPYAQNSGGTIIPLKTTNESAAEMFVIGRTYEVNISQVD